jgi:hypothetical protein
MGLLKYKQIGLVDPEFYKKLMQAESGGRNIKNPQEGASAAGVYQFTEGTWDGMVKSMGLDYNLNDRYDPKKQEVVIKGFTKQNEKYLSSKLGRKPNNTELYAAHFLGNGGANKFLSEVRDSPDGTSTPTDEELRYNKKVFLNSKGKLRTNLEVYNELTRRIEGKSKVKDNKPVVSNNEYADTNSTELNTFDYEAGKFRDSQNIENYNLTPNVTNFQYLQENSNFEEESQADQEKSSKAANTLRQKSNELDFIEDWNKTQEDNFKANYQNPVQSQQQEAEPIEDFSQTYNRISEFVDSPIAKEGGPVKDQQGQRKYPGQVTEIQGNSMATDGYGDTTLYVVPNVGQPKMVQPNTGNHTFPGATKFTEYPVAQQGKQVKYGTPEYTEAYNKGEVITDEGERSPIALDEVVIQNNYKRDRGFWEQYRDKIVEENKDASILGVIMGTPIYAIASLPQMAATYAFTGKAERPSEAMNIQNPWGAMAVDMVADPANLIGAGILTKEKALARLAKSTESGLLSKAPKLNPWAFKPKPENFYKQIEVPKSNLQSEINWSKWNKEIPDNTELLKEYNTIEQTTKSNGTWMKNDNGSKFNGTPEQFVQQQSDNFKKSFGNTKVRDNNGNIQIAKHTTFDEFDSFDMNKFGKTDNGFYGKGSYFHPKSNDAGSYGDIQMDTYLNIQKPIQKENISFFGREGKGTYWDSLKDKQVVIDDVSSLWKNKNDGVITDHANYPYNDFNSTEYVTNIPTNIKSATGNNGMFDMTNPNIYKSVVPGAIGLGAASQIQGQDIPQYQQGGEISENELAFLKEVQSGRIIKDQQGQRNHPGQVTEIQGNSMATDGYGDTTLYVVPNVGQPKVIQANTGNHSFPGATEFTEYPMAQQGGFTLKDINQKIIESTQTNKPKLNKKELSNIILDYNEFDNSIDIKKPRAEANKIENFLPNKNTVDFFNKIKKDLGPEYFTQALNVQYERGNPSVNIGTDKGLLFHNSINYNPFTNEINIPKSKYKKAIDEDGKELNFDIEGMNTEVELSSYISEIAHSGQPLTPTILKFISNDIPNYLKSYIQSGNTKDNITKNVYKDNKNVEGYTHNVIEPSIKKYIYDYRPLMTNNNFQQGGSTSKNELAF